MSAADMREMIEFASKAVEQIFRRTGSISPMVHFVDGNGDHGVLHLDLPDKDMSSAMMRALFELKGVKRYVFIDEAWQASATGDQAKKLEQACQRGELDRYPGRDEIVMFSGEDQDAGQFLARRLIERPPGTRPRLGPLIIDDAWTQSSGRFVGMLPRRAGEKMQ